LNHGPSTSCHWRHDLVKEATAAPRHPEVGDGYKAAVINYGFLANAVLTTTDVVKALY
jgi:hypothetical protein